MPKCARASYAESQQFVTRASFGATKPAVRLSPKARTRLGVVGAVVEREVDGATEATSSSDARTRLGAGVETEEDGATEATSSSDASRISTLRSSMANTDVSRLMSRSIVNHYDRLSLKVDLES